MLGKVSFLLSRALFAATLVAAPLAVGCAGFEGDPTDDEFAVVTPPDAGVSCDPTDDCSDGTNGDDQVGVDEPTTGDDDCIPGDCPEAPASGMEDGVDLPDFSGTIRIPIDDGDDV